MSKELFEFHDKEFLENNWHWPPGYYFRDEEGDLYGPFLSEQQRNVGWKIYLEGRMSGRFLLPGELTKIIQGD